ncbi:MAG: hypothetical protein IJ295_00400, partial [Clostridia bacterium]|nr:hypothetical protein [Clostridia bacterium]
IQNADGESVSNNYAYGSENGNNDGKNFVYDRTQPLTISFVESNCTNDKNKVQLLNKAGLYHVRITVQEVQPEFADGNKYSGGYANSKTKHLYFYVQDGYERVSPVIDENNVFQVSDVYLWEGKTFSFNKPTFTDANTPTDKIQVDYYLVALSDITTDKVVALDAGENSLRVDVDLDDLGLEAINKYNKFYIYAVARNFNAMQNKLYVATGKTLSSGTYFEDNLLLPDEPAEDVAKNGYAWKRAEFAIHEATSANEAGIEVKLEDEFHNTENNYIAGKPVRIYNIETEWASKVDGQMSVSVYQVKENDVLVPVNVVDSNKTSSAQIVSSVSFYRTSHTMSNLYFTPGVGGDYIIVVTAKDHASAKVSTNVTKIQIGSSGDWGVTPLSLGTKAVADYTVDKTITMGESLVLPNWVISKDNSSTEKYFAKNRQLYKYNAEGDLVAPEANDYYTITVKGVNDQNCITGNKFVPNKDGQYVFQYDFYVSKTKVKTINYVVQVNSDSSASSSIRVNESYDDNKVLWNVATSDSDGDGKHKIGDKYYVVGATEKDGTEKTGTEKKPAYAIILEQFVNSNYGDATDFVVDSASLFEYLEPIYKDGAITGYMYPAIAIPMPNLISDIASSDEVEITVQKSGNSNYLVSSKKKNAGGIANNASVIEQIDGYF